jgi:AraC-like DNA-binding protein
LHTPGQDSAVLETPPLDLNSWRTAIAETVVPLSISEYGGTPFLGRFRRTSVGQVGLFEMQTTAHTVRRTPELITADQPVFYKMSLQLEGRAELQQDGRTAVLSPGDIAVYDTHRPYTLSFPEPSRAMIMIFPQAMVELSPHELSRLTAVRFCAEEGLARMISPFFTELIHNLDQLSGGYGSRLVHSALDLMVTMLSKELHRQDQSGHGSSHRLSWQIRQYILRNLSDESLTPSTIATAHFISVRYLYTLFAEDEHTVSAWIRSQRLAHIRRDLTDPLLAHRPVSWIAGRWGLHDAAHFSRLFKSEHGVSPSAYRRLHLQAEPHLAAA